MTSKEFNAIREQLGESQESLALLLGVERRTVLRWEAGPVPTVVALAMEQLLAHRALTQIGVGFRTRLTFLNQTELSNAEAAQYLGIDRRTLLDKVKHGLIPQPKASLRRVDKQNRRVAVFQKKDLDDYLMREGQREGRLIYSKLGGDNQ